MRPSSAPSSTWAAASAWKWSPKASNRSRHLDFLRKHHCQYGQGKIFGEPCTADDLLALLKRQAAGTLPFAHLLPQAEGLSSRSA